MMTVQGKEAGELGRRPSLASPASFAVDEIRGSGLLVANKTYGGSPQ
jgi:hypothetical protein